MRPLRTTLAIGLIALATLVLSTGSAGATELSDRLSKTIEAPDGLAHESSRESMGVGFERYSQEIDGVRVLDSEVVVVDRPGEPARVVADRTKPAVERPQAPAVSRRSAVEIAHRAIGLREPRARTIAERAIQTAPDGGRQVWEVLVPAARPIGDFRVLVDAQSGRPISKRNLAVSARGSARLFLPNPVVGNLGSRDGLADARDVDSQRLTELRVPVALPRLRGGSNCLEGAFVVAVARARSVCSRSRDWRSLTRADPEFEAVMSYFHIDRAASYIRSLGITGASYRRLAVNANGIRADNSFFLPLDRSITYGRGGVDDAEDGDVVIHEYGHAVQDAQGADFRTSEQGNAIAEGFGDYLTAAMTARIGGTSAEDAACVFDWDALGLGQPCLRRTDLDLGLAGLSDDCRNDFHCAGQVWSAALWRLRGLLGSDGSGKSIMDRVVLQSNFALPTSAGFRAGAQALLGADEQLYDGLHRAEIEAELTSRDLL